MLIEAARGMAQIVDERRPPDLSVDAHWRDAGQHVDLPTIDSTGVLDGDVDAGAEFGDAVGVAGDSTLTASPVAGRRVDQYLLQAVRVEQFGHHSRGIVIGKPAFHAQETRLRGGAEALQKRSLGEQHRQVGGEAWHAGGG